MKPGARSGVQTMSRASAWVLVLLGAVIMLAPFYMMFVFASHPRADIFQVPPPFFFTACTLLFCSMGGYAFAMYEFRFKQPLFAIVMGTLLIPPFLGMIPNFMVMDFLGWMDRPIALYLPGAAGAFGIFMVRQYVLSSVPRELIEAARMDGCGEFRIYWSIVLPLLGPALGTLALISFISSWNNFISPLVVMRSLEMYTLPLALRSMQNPVNTEWGAIMAGSALAALPLLVLFALASRRLINGLVSGAVRG